MAENGRELLDELDNAAKELSRLPVAGTTYTNEILRTIARLYRSAKDETRFSDEFFESAYHSPVTGDVEFYLARIFYWYSRENSLGWKIFLRRQIGKVVPDIRITFSDKTIAVIEVKAKVGFQQCCFSKERYDYDVERFRSGKSTTDPDQLIRKLQDQFQKYHEAFNLSKDRLYLLLPSLGTAHRKKYSSKLEQYYEYVSSTTSLPVKSLIILSENLRLNLSDPRSTDFRPTSNVERMLLTISGDSSAYLNAEAVL